MQDIVVADVLVRIEMEPALAALVLRVAVPGNRQGLQPAIRKFDQILLQRIDAERVFDLEDVELSIRSVGFDKKFSIFPEEARLHAVVGESRAGKIAKHRLLGRVIHGVPVMGSAPEFRLLLMAAGADFAANKCKRRYGAVRTAG